MADFETPEHEAVASTPFETPEHEATDQSPLESAARGALRNVPLAQQVAAAAAPINPFSEKKTYGEELSHLTEAAEAGKAQNPKSYGAGAVAGTVAPLLIPGVGAGLEAAPFLGNAALGAAGGASDVNLTKPTARDVGGIAAQGLLAGGIGKAFSGLGKLFGRGGSAAEKAGAEEVAAEAAPAAAPVTEAAAPEAIPTPKIEPKPEIAGIAVPSKTVSPEFKPNAERIYASNLAQGLGGTPRQLMRVFGKQNPVEALNEIGNWMETAGPGGKSLHGLLDRPGELLEKVDSVHDAAGEQIGTIIDEMSKANPTKFRVALGPGTDIGASVDREGLLAELREFAQKTADPATEARINKLVSTAERLDSKPISDFEMLQQIKEMAGKQISKDPEMAQVYGSLADRVSKLVDAYGKQINDPDLLNVYNKAKLDYHNSSRLLPMLRYVEGRELVGGPAGHFSLRGLLSTIVNTTLGIGGLPPAGQFGKNVMLKTAPAVRNVANLRPSGVRIPGLAPAAAQELANALSSKYGKPKQ